MFKIASASIVGQKNTNLEQNIKKIQIQDQNEKKLAQKCYKDQQMIKSKK